MKIEWKNVAVKGRNITAKITTYEKGDGQRIKNLYNLWNTLNRAIKAISTRGINLPEAISENAFCLFFPGCIRVIKLRKGFVYFRTSFRVGRTFLFRFFCRRWLIQSL